MQVTDMKIHTRRDYLGFLKAPGNLPLKLFKPRKNV